MPAATPTLAIRPLLAAFALIVLATARVDAQGPPAGLPPPASPQAEAIVEGDLDVMYEDSVAGSRLLHFVNAAGRRLRLIFDGDLPPGLATGSRVRLRGRVSGDTLELSQGGGSVEAMSLASTSTFGEQRTLVLLVNFEDVTTQPYTVANAHQVTFQDVSAFFLENSYQQTWLTGDTVGWITLPMTSGTCDYYRISSLAEQAAASQGISVNQYARRIFAFPQIGACGWWGLGNVGGNPSRSWVNGSYALKVVAHELGHNFGVHHSRSASCDTSGCSTSEYGDTHDIMGKPTGHMNAYQKERVGWLNYGQSPPTQTVTTSGSYWVDTMATAGSAPKALRILKSIDGNGYRTWYYVETRAKTGFDASLSPGVIVHTGSEATVNSSLQIDMTPAASGFDAVLDAGHTFSDPSIGLTISTVGVTSSGASVFIDYPGAPCTMRAPSISLTPGTVTISAGQTTSFVLSVRNMDDSTCAPADLLVGAAVPSGWTVTSGAMSLLVAPGATASTTLVVTPAAGASGTSTISAQLSRRNSTGPGGSSSATVVVATALDVTLSISKAKGGITFDAAVRAAGSPVSGSTVTFTIIDPTGATRTLLAVTNGSGLASTKWKPGRRDPRGTYQVRAAASSGALSGAATGTFQY